MQITLKQTEIIEALKMYVQRQGLSLAGKAVDITFTASRGDTGLLANLSIEEVELPHLTQGDLDFAEARTGLKVVSAVVPDASIVRGPETATAFAGMVGQAQNTEGGQDKPTPDEKPAAVAPATEAAAAKSLFG